MGEQRADDGDRIHARPEQQRRRIESNPSDGHQRLRRQFPQLRNARKSQGRLRILFRLRSEGGPDGEIIDRLRIPGGELYLVVCGEADHGLRPKKPAGIGGRQVVLPYMNAGAEQQGDVHAIIHDEPHTRIAAQLREMLRFRIKSSGIVAFVAQLKQPRATLDHPFGDVQQGSAAPLDGVRVKNGV